MWSALSSTIVDVRRAQRAVYEGALLDHSARADVFNQMWVMADADTFLPDNDALIAYNKDSRDKGKNTKLKHEKTLEDVTENINTNLKEQ